MLDPDLLIVAESSDEEIPEPGMKRWYLERRDFGELRLPPVQELVRIFNGIYLPGGIQANQSGKDDYGASFLVPEGASFGAMELFKEAVARHPDTY